MPDHPAERMRVAQAADAPAVAGLHVRSWRATYRGSLADAYLDGPIEAERDAFWHARLRHPRPGLITLLMETGEGAPIGFICALADHDPTWGTLIDNLHVDPAAKRGGRGRRLMQALAGHLVQAGSVAPVHLFVLASNAAAGGFYARMGGRTVERVMKTEPDGQSVPVDRIAWTSLAAFAEATG